MDNKERDKYKETPFEDTGVSNGNTYYYGIFPYTDEGIFNYSAENICKITVTEINGIFGDATWEQIIYACQTNNVPGTWNVGDEKELVLTGEYAQTVTMQIWGKNTDDYADGSGKAPLTFGSKECLIQSAQFDTQDREWPECSLRTWFMGNIKQCLPEEVRNAVKKIKTKTAAFRYSEGILTAEDDLWVPGPNNLNIHAGAETGSIPYPIFTDNTSRKKNSTGGSVASYWTRGGGESTILKCITIDGTGAADYTVEKKGWRNVCFGFCL